MIVEGRFEQAPGAREEQLIQLDVHDFRARRLAPDEVVLHELDPQHPVRWARVEIYLVIVQHVQSDDGRDDFCERREAVVASVRDDGEFAVEVRDRC